jgi:hypothetical protein
MAEADRQSGRLSENEIYQRITQIASRYELFQCVECAKAIIKELKWRISSNRN